ncbi:MAG: hypothetical protein QOF18_340, partial [Frankiaceae bacterium]|nr:hypothetical protein [Frankiaceae bacterium]
AIYAAPRTGAHMILGPVYRKWEELGRAGGPFGLPVTDTRTIEGTRLQFSDFEHGAIYSHPVLGTHPVPEPVLLLWDHYDRHRGPLGRVTTDLLAGTAGEHQEFEYGTVTANPALGIHAVWGPIFDYWASQSREDGTYGFPVSDVYAVDADHDRCDFQNGSLMLDKTTGAVTQV